MLKQRVILEFDDTSPFGLRIERRYMVEHKDAVIAAMKSKFEFKEGQTYYYLPDVSIPRFKLKMFGEKLKVKSTRSTDKADYIFIGSLPTNKHVGAMSNQEVTYEKLKQVTIIDTNLFNTLKEIPEFEAIYPQLLKDFKMFGLYMSLDTISKLETYIRDKFHKYMWFGYGFESRLFLTLKSPKLLSKLVYQDELMSLVNEDSLIITDEKKEELQSMFNSSDDSNIVLAMEIMANSNYEESIINNYKLLKENLNKIGRQKESSHRNFQSLLMFYGLDLRHMTQRIKEKDVDQIADMLKDYQKLTREAMKTLLLWYANDNNQFVGKYCNSVLVANTDVEFDGE